MFPENDAICGTVIAIQTFSDLRGYNPHCQIPMRDDCFPDNGMFLVLDMIMNLGRDGLETYKRFLEINLHQKAIIVSGFSETDRV